MQPVFIRREFQYLPELVFNAWIKPEMVENWLFIGNNNRLLKVDIDARVGGKFSILEQSATGETVAQHGQFHEIDSPRRLRFSLEVPERFEGVSEVTVEISNGIHGTLMEFTQTNVVADVTVAAWKMMFNRLDLVLDDQYAQV